MKAKILHILFFIISLKENQRILYYMIFYFYIHAILSGEMNVISLTLIFLLNIDIIKYSIKHYFNIHN